MEHQVGANGEVLQRALSWRGAAVYLLGQRRRVAWMNAIAAQQARSLRGPFTVEASTLCATDASATAALCKAIGLVGDGAPEARFDARDRDGRRIAVNALSGHAAGLASSGDEQCVVICGAPSFVRDVGNCLRAAFGLTEAETEIALGVADGLSVPDIADRRGIRELTIRTQLKRIYAKTGARRQSELAVLVWRWAALNTPVAGEAPPAPIALRA